MEHSGLSLLYLFIFLGLFVVKASSESADRTDDLTQIEQEESQVEPQELKRSPPFWYVSKGKKAPVFLGMRGKKSLDYDDQEIVKKAPSGFMGMRGKKAPASGFFGMRGKKAPAESSFFGMRGKKAPSGFMGMRGKKAPYGFTGLRGKKAPSGFMGMRGKKEDDEKSITDYIMEMLQEQEAEKRAPPRQGFLAFRGRR